MYTSQSFIQNERANFKIHKQHWGNDNDIKLISCDVNFKKLKYISASLLNMKYPLLRFSVNYSRGNFHGNYC